MSKAQHPISMVFQTKSEHFSHTCSTTYRSLGNQRRVILTLLGLLKSTDLRNFLYLLMFKHRTIVGAVKRVKMRTDF